MRKLTFELPKQRQLEINGAIFDIKKNDTDVIETAMALHNKYTNAINTNADFLKKAEMVVGSVREIEAHINDILGEDAVYKIIGDTPLGVTEAIKLMMFVCQGVMEEYNATVAEKYKDD